MLGTNSILPHLGRYSHALNHEIASSQSPVLTAKMARGRQAVKYRPHHVVICSFVVHVPNMQRVAGGALEGRTWMFAALCERQDWPMEDWRCRIEPTCAVAIGLEAVKFTSWDARLGVLAVC
jgi:hypothetical protein